LAILSRNIRTVVKSLPREEPERHHSQFQKTNFARSVTRVLIISTRSSERVYM